MHVLVSSVLSAYTVGRRISHEQCAGRYEEARADSTGVRTTSALPEKQAHSASALMWSLSSSEAKMHQRRRWAFIASLLLLSASDEIHNHNKRRQQ